MDISAFFKKLVRYLLKSDYRFRVNARLGFYNSMPDDKYLKRMFCSRMGKQLNLENPQTFNEKLQWLKLYNRKPEYSMMVDKYLVRQYIAEKIGEEYVIPLLGVWDDPDEIDFNTLPEQFVLKCNHDSGELCICRDKKQFDINWAKHKLRKSLKTNYYLKSREWPYKDVSRKIIAEKYMEENNGKGHELYDYKFYCFNGEPLYLYVSHGLENHETAQITFLNLDWERAPFGRLDYKPFEEIPKRPVHLEEMIKIAKQLSEGIPFLRVDLYEITERIYFSELTFFPCAGFMPFTPSEWDRKLGDSLDLHEIV